MELTEVKILSEKIKENVSRVIVGKSETMDLILTSLFCSGHILLEDVPGTGKTVLAKCLARSVNCDFKRIQFTPDLLPSDLTGINYYNQKQGEFVFRPGPLFSNIILADEINRATPRTQSSLLECMEERQVTIDGETHGLMSPFLVIATQNPVETQGTFPLPEAQLDRFFLRLKMGYPTPEEGRKILDRFQNENPMEETGVVAEAREIIDAQQSFSRVKISDDVKEYMIHIIEATRKHERIALGVSPRGSLALLRAARVYAVLKGYDFVTPDHVKCVAIPVLAHRIVLRAHALGSSTDAAEAMIKEILDKVEVPKERIEN